jgi:hypothetical protein
VERWRILLRFPGQELLGFGEFGFGIWIVYRWNTFGRRVDKDWRGRG